jgi:predicted KAP-like P-loop ATPase
MTTMPTAGSIKDDDHPFSADRPIRSKKDELLGRADFAVALADAIRGWRQDESLVVALHGRWGAGKSSFKRYGGMA